MLLIFAVFNKFYNCFLLTGIGGNLFFILTVSLLSWYHWSDSVWMEDAKQKILTRAAESRQKRGERFVETTPDISSFSTSNDESNKAFDEDDEDISIIDEKILHKMEDDIEELAAIREVRQRKPAKFVDVSIGTSELNL